MVCKRWFVAATLLLLWFWLNGISISLKISMFPLLKYFLAKREYLQLAKSEILTILFYLHIQSKRNVCGLNSIVLSVFSFKVVFFLVLYLKFTRIY